MPPRRLTCTGARPRRVVPTEAESLKETTLSFLRPAPLGAWPGSYGRGMNADASQIPTSNSLLLRTAPPLDLHVNR